MTVYLLVCYKFFGFRVFVFCRLPKYFCIFAGSSLHKMSQNSALSPNSNESQIFEENKKKSVPTKVRFFRFVTESLDKEVHPGIGIYIPGKDLSSVEISEQFSKVKIPNPQVMFTINQCTAPDPYPGMFQTLANIADVQLQEYSDYKAEKEKLKKLAAQKKTKAENDADKENTDSKPPETSTKSIEIPNKFIEMEFPKPAAYSSLLYENLDVAIKAFSSGSTSEGKDSENEKTSKQFTIENLNRLKKKNVCFFSFSFYNYFSGVRC